MDSFGDHTRVVSANKNHNNYAVNHNHSMQPITITVYSKSATDEDEHILKTNTSCLQFFIVQNCLWCNIHYT